jgi:hypothetical protein
MTEGADAVEANELLDSLFDVLGRVGCFDSFSSFCFLLCVAGWRNNYM